MDPREELEELRVENRRLRERLEKAQIVIQEQAPHILSLEQELGKRIKELEASNSEFEGLCYSMSHDLRAPLRSAAGFVQIMLEDDACEPQERRDRLNVCKKAVRRMEEVIDALLSYSRIARITLENTAVDLDELVSGLKEEFEPLVQGRSIEWKIGRAT